MKSLRLIFLICLLLLIPGAAFSNGFGGLWKNSKGRMTLPAGNTDIVTATYTIPEATVAPTVATGTSGAYYFDSVGLGNDPYGPGYGDWGILKSQLVTENLCISNNRSISTNAPIVGWRAYLKKPAAYLGSPDVTTLIFRTWTMGLVGEGAQYVQNMDCTSSSDNFALSASWTDAEGWFTFYNSVPQQSKIGDMVGSRIERRKDYGTPFLYSQVCGMDEAQTRKRHQRIADNGTNDGPIVFTTPFEWHYWANNRPAVGYSTFSEEPLIEALVQAPVLVHIGASITVGGNNTTHVWGFRNSDPNGTSANTGPYDEDAVATSYIARALGVTYQMAGVSGDNSTQMLARFEEDVLNKHPKICIISAGANDIAKADPKTEEGFTAAIAGLIANLTTMSNLCDAAGIIFIVTDIQPVAENIEDLYPVLEGYRHYTHLANAAIMSLVATQPSMKFIDARDVLGHYSDVAGGMYIATAEYVTDGLHYSAAGHVAMGNEYARQITAILSSGSSMWQRKNKW